jgi:hypothetical protein
LELERAVYRSLKLHFSKKLSPGRYFEDQVQVS